MTAWALADLALARRLERTEASANAAFVESRARLQPATGAGWIDVGGAYAMFDGVGSPITQTFGLGLFSPGTDDDLVAIEGFFAARGAEVFHEVSPMADAGLLARLGARGYRPVELTSVMHRPIDAPHPTARATDVRVRAVDAGEAALYADTSARGWSESAELVEFVRGFAEIGARARGSHVFLGEIGGEPVGAAQLVVHERVALLAGASTVPAWRGRGAQAALLAARLDTARRMGCDLAMMCAAPGSASQRNAERLGFRIAYTRIKWGRAG